MGSIDAVVAVDHIRAVAEHAFDVEGMSCEHCVRAVKSALESVPGVAKADVRVGHAEVDAEAPATRDVLVEAIEREGYRVIGR